MNSYFQKERNNKVFRYIGVLLLLVILFVVTYNIADNSAQSNREIDDSENKTAYNAADGLEDDFLIILKDYNDKKELSILDFKKEKDIDANISEEYLVRLYTNEGYNLVGLTSTEITFEKEESVGLIPNKFYLGIKDGFFAVYKSDENGNPFIESERDIYTGKSVSTIPVSAEEDLKNFKYYYDTKEEAVEKLSAYMN